MRKFLVPIIAAATIASAGIAFAFVNPLAGAGAAGQPSPTTTAAAGRAPRPHPLDEALAALVADKTLTADQAAKVKAAVAARTKADRGSFAPGKGAKGLPGALGRRPGILRAGLKTAADTIGIAPKDLLAGLRSGQSVAQIATAHHVDPKKVVDALVAQADGAIDKALQAGRITTQRAAELKAKAPAAAQKLVDHVGLRR